MSACGYKSPNQPIRQHGEYTPSPGRSRPGAEVATMDVPTDGPADACFQALQRIECMIRHHGGSSTQRSRNYPRVPLMVHSEAKDGGNWGHPATSPMVQPLELIVACRPGLSWRFGSRGIAL